MDRKLSYCDPSKQRQIIQPFVCLQHWLLQKGVGSPTITRPRLVLWPFHASECDRFSHVTQTSRMVDIGLRSANRAASIDRALTSFVILSTSVDSNSNVGKPTAVILTLPLPQPPHCLLPQKCSVRGCWYRAAPRWGKLTANQIRPSGAWLFRMSGLVSLSSRPREPSDAHLYARIEEVCRGPKNCTQPNLTLAYEKLKDR